MTHQIGYLYDCDNVIIMDDGAVSASGSPISLSKHLKELSEIFEEEANIEVFE